MFWFEMLIATIALVLILIGIWHEEKLIAFEERLWDVIADRIGYALAQVVICYRRLNAKRKESYNGRK